MDDGFVARHSGFGKGRQVLAAISRA
jgi:hypothetical protein